MKNYLLLLFIFHHLQADDFNALIKEYPSSTDSSKINIVVKDNIDIKGTVTSAGSLALENNIAKENAFLIDKLLINGFHIKGKANLSEWANFRSTNSISGWSSINGQTMHPLNKEYNPCGSSSGSAVAVASGIVDVAIGTETNGSITCPASVVGVVGMKPTLGLVSRSGIIPISESQDTAGPIGISVEIVALTLQSIAGLDSSDLKTKEIPTSFDFNFKEAVSNKTLNGQRFGLLDSGFNSEHGKNFLKILVQNVRDLGGEIIFIEDERKYPSAEEYFVLLYEFKYGLEDYLKHSSEEKKSLKEIIDFNNENSKVVMPFFNQEIFYAAEDAAKDLNKYRNSKAALMASKNKTLELMNQYNLDAFIGLTRGPAWKINYQGGDGEATKDTLSFGNGGYAAFGGLPHITIPYFKINNFPVGLSFIGRPWADKQIISFAAALEKEANDM